ncbi:acyloxyacyl hydrolase [Agarilytica rhodophyticola]|uniref:acyloxyacyl hydrolase n=1 Tax=Agarilytica rhodophyticola TaxID=1737490 RepID=UPI000B340F53|nr:acyloxyacyl hydrolase [Agarilytica rhodophyticola]
MLLRYFIIGVVTFLSTFNPVQAKQSLGLDYLHGSDDITGLRLTYRPIVNHVPFAKWIGKASIYWEGSISFWEYGAENSHQTNFALSLSPVIVKRLSREGVRHPIFIEGGIGASLVHDRKFAGKDIGSHYQFEDRLGVIIGLDKERSRELSIRYMHYSNGGLDSKNPGLDFLSVSYVHNF